VATLLALAVAVARVKVGAHSISEAALGFGVGLAVALLFFRRADANRRGAPRPLLIALGLAMLVLPRAEPDIAHQWLTGLALTLAKHDRPYDRDSWQPDTFPYTPPCPPEKVHFGYMCT
jgi:hypothetical protein